MEEDRNEVLMIPLVCKEQSDERHYKIGRLLVILLIISNLLWASTWIAYWLVPSQAQNVLIEGTEGNANYVEGEGDVSITNE